MPQLTIEYSANIIEKNGLPALLASCHALLASSLPTDINTCKSRAMECTTFCVGDGQADKAFVHVTLKVMPGRSEKLKSIGESMMELLNAHFTTSLQTLNLQITLELMELNTHYFKIQSAPRSPL